MYSAIQIHDWPTRFWVDLHFIELNIIWVGVELEDINKLLNNKNILPNIYNLRYT